MLLDEIIALLSDQKRVSGSGAIEDQGARAPDWAQRARPMGVGSQNFQVTNQREDIEGLLQEIKKLGFEQSELDALRTALLEDRSKGKTPDVTEGETGKWFGKALKDAVKGLVKAGRRRCVECHCEGDPNLYGQRLNA